MGALFHLYVQVEVKHHPPKLIAESFIWEKQVEKECILTVFNIPLALFVLLGMTACMVFMAVKNFRS